MGQARYGAASEVGFAKADYDEYGNRTSLSGNQKAGVAGVGLGAAGVTTAVRSASMPVRAAEQLRFAQIRRGEAKTELDAARKRAAANAGSGSAKRALDSAEVKYAGQRKNVHLFRNNLNNIGARQKLVRTTGLGVAGTGAALAGAAWLNGRRSRSAV